MQRSPPVSLIDFCGCAGGVRVQLHPQRIAALSRGPLKCLSVRKAMSTVVRAFAYNGSGLRPDINDADFCVLLFLECVFYLHTDMSSNNC